MGCDFVFSGKLSDLRAQEKAVKWIAEYYENEVLIIQPRPEKDCLTIYKTLLDGRMWGHKRNANLMQYPFDYFGVVPLHGFVLEEHGQVIFDRSADGRLVRFLKLPNELGLVPSDESCKNLKAEVVVNEGGYARLMGNRWPYALLLNIMSIRWFSELQVQDDFFVYRDTDKVLRESGLLETFRDESMNFQECWDLYIVEYGKRYPLYPV